jgi:uncharacterized protein YkwD
MLSLTRRSFIVLGAGGLLGACSSTMPSIAPADNSPEALTTASIISHVNAVRAANGAPAWSYNPSLEAAARQQARLMAEKDQLSHDLGPSLRQRVAAAGYDGAVGENVGGGQRNLPGVLEGWLNSSGHRSTLLSTKFVEFGLAYARVPAARKSRYGIYWALVAGGSFDAWRVFG